MGRGPRPSVQACGRLARGGGGGVDVHTAGGRRGPLPVSSFPFLSLLFKEEACPADVKDGCTSARPPPIFSVKSSHHSEAGTGSVPFPNLSDHPTRAPSNPGQLSSRRFLCTAPPHALGKPSVQTRPPTHARRLLCEVPPSPLRGSQNRWHEREREQGLLWAPWDGHPPPDAVRAPAPVINVPNSETHRRFQTQTPGAIGFHDFSRSLGYGLARICSPLNYSSGIRKTQQHLSLPWRPRLIPPHSQTLREPEIIPGPIYDCPRPCPP